MPAQSHTRRREKLFGEGRCLPLDRNAKARIMMLARALTHRTEKGKHYGVLTAKFVRVLEALLWGFHNAATGRCFPSYERIAEKANCARSTVYEAIRALERAGILTWVQPARAHPRMGARPVRPRTEPLARHPHVQRLHLPRSEPGARPPDSSKSKFQTGTADQELNLLLPSPAKPDFDSDQPAASSPEPIWRSG